MASILLWLRSFYNNQPFLENSAWRLKNGQTIILPNSLNTTHSAQIEGLNFPSIGRDERGNVVVNYSGTWEQVEAFIHTHPSMQIYGIGVSAADINLMNQLDGIRFETIYNSTIYQVWKNGAYDSIGHVQK